MALGTAPGDVQQEFGDLSDNVHDDLPQVEITQAVYQYSHLWDLPISMGSTSSLAKKYVYIDPKPKFRLNVKTTFKTDLIATEDLDHDSDEFKERVRKDVNFYTVLPDKIKTDAKKQRYLEDDFEKRCIALYNLKVGKHLLGRPGKYRLASLLFRKAREDYPEYFRKYRNKVSERFVN